MAVRTRFAPSPTGYLHLGSVRTALYAWLYARHHGGEFVLRIEDTDRERSTEAAVNAILEGMSWLGLDADEGPIYQSRRLSRYREVINDLVQEEKAYHCYCTRAELDAMRLDAQQKGRKPRYDGRCRQANNMRNDIDPVVRFKNPLDGQVIVNDAVKGAITFENSELDDLIIARSDGSPTYNFSVVVDDSDMEISHVIRGDDHLNNTPRQINVFAALGATAPVYAHLPMIHGPDGTKLSKRHGAVNVLEYEVQGFLPQAVLNYLVRLGWAHEDQEIFSLDELISLFDLNRVNRAPANFDPDKFLWVNQQHVKAAPTEQLTTLLAEQLAAQNLRAEDGPPLETVVDSLRDRSQTIRTMAESAHCYFTDFDEFDRKAAKAHLRPVAREPLLHFRRAASDLQDWSQAATQKIVEDVAADLALKLGKVAQPLRVALTGQAASPDIGTTLLLVGKQRTLQRVDRALAYIEEREQTNGPAA